MSFFSLFRFPFRKKTHRITRLRKITHTTQGEHYDLQQIYDQLNETYFGNRLKLTITWFGSPNRKVKSQRILGLYCFTTTQIKVHRLLDHPHFPPYFVSYVVYHEMLHSVHPPQKKKRGRWKIHHGEFKQSEKCFLEYEQARNFEKQNLNTFFMSREDIYGRAQ